MIVATNPSAAAIATAARIEKLCKALEKEHQILRQQLALPSTLDPGQWDYKFAEELWEEHGIDEHGRTAFAKVLRAEGWVKVGRKKNHLQEVKTQYKRLKSFDSAPLAAESEPEYTSPLNRLLKIAKKKDS